MVAGENRGYGGNAGYDDQYDAYYSWDSNVPNSTRLQIGHPVAVWDKERLLGVSVIEAITSEPGMKVLSRCPRCSAPQITERTRDKPRFRCNKCRAEFETPRTEAVEVTRYKARYDAAWTSLEGLLSGDELKSVQKNRGEFNAMRALDWTAFSDALLTKKAGRAVQRVAGRLADTNWSSSELAVELPGGFHQALVRVRKGQGNFRQHLLASQGSICAFTGGAPERVLEAGHLYSYARLGEHHAHGGLMLRRDIHRLFDDGLLAVQPNSMRIDVGEHLSAYSQYAELHDEPLKLQLRDEQVNWLAKHWEEHRASPTLATSHGAR